jgi:antitoxin component of MazEF toxin-antitoxin module
LCIDFTFDRSTLITNTKSPSLRTTVPESVVNELKVKEGDAIEWERIIYNGKIAIRVKKAEG